MPTTTNREAPNTLLSTQTLRVTDVLCEGPISGFIIKSGEYGSDPLCSTYYDDVPVRNPDGSYNFNVSGEGFSFNYMLGTTSQTGITGFQKIENLLPLSSNTRIANPPQGGGPYKTVVASFTTNTFPDADSVKVTVRVPALFAQDDNANTNLYEIQWAIDISVNGSPFEPQEIPAGSLNFIDTIRGKCTQPYMKTVTLPLPKPGGLPFYDWKIRVRRVSQNILLLKTQNEIYVDSISVVSTSLFGYPNTAVVATEISADQFSSIPSRSYEIAGMLVNVPKGYTPTQYPTTGGIVPASYPTVWDGTFQSGVWTDNPAWIFYDILTNPIHGLGDYILPQYVDKWTLYSIAQYCDTLVSTQDGGYEPQFTCNVQIQQPEEAYSVLLNLASTFRGMLYYANGTIHAVQTKDTPPVFQFTNANVINGSFSYSDSARNTRATVAVVKWIDPNNGYREGVEYIEDVDGILKYGYNEKQMTAFACTSRGQAYRLGSWTLQTERLQTETITFQTDLEGIYLRPGDNFAVYDNFRNNRSQGGRITAFQTGRSVVTTDRPVEILSGVTYVLTAIIPQLTLMGTGDVTGSSQIDYIRNSQIESYPAITSATTSTSTLTIQGQFNTGLFVGSPFLLSASGYTGTFNEASFYTCLATAEVEPGKIEILGLKAPTGVYFRVLTGTPVIDYDYPAYDWPANNGDQSTIAAPSNLVVTKITGALSDNSVYTNIKLSWTDSPSVNLAQYVVSGKAWDEDYTPVLAGTNSYTWERAKTGQYLFKVGALSLGGVHSAYITGGIFVQYLNPFDTMPVISGIEIAEDYDPLYRNFAGKYTGYMGRTPTFQWSVTGNGTNNVPEAQFISGYRLNIRDFADTIDYVSPIILTGADNTSYQFPETLIASFAGGAQRGFKLKLDVFDIDNEYYNNVASLNINNPPMKPPFSTGFVGYNGGISYNITPSVQYDTSGVMMWCDASPSFSPTFSNYEYVSSNLAGFANIAPYTGSFYTWYSLVDTWGSLGNTIYGPISGNADQMFGSFSLSIDAQINEALSQIDSAFLLITGEITNSLVYVSGNANKAITSVDALSGQVTGLPGVVNTSLNVRVNSIVVTSSGALSQQINAVRALTETTGQLLTAQVGTVTTALTNTGVALGQTITVTNASVSGALNTKINATGASLLASQAAGDGALSSWITNLGVQTTGASAAVRIGAEALVTGSTNGLGGVAIARWGFELDANGKAASLKATSTSFSDIGDLVLGNMNIKSSTFAAGSAGWQIGWNGDAEFNNIVARGFFTGGAGSYKIGIDGGRFFAGNPSNDRIEIPVGAGGTTVRAYNPSNVQVATLGSTTLGAGYFGYITAADTAGSITVSIGGNNGSVNCDILDVDSTSNFDGAADFNSTLNVDGLATFNGEALVNGADKLYFYNTSNGTYIQEDYGLNLWGDGTHPIKIRGAALVRGSSAGGSYTAGDIYGFGILFGADTTDSNTFSCDTVAGSDHTFANYFKVRSSAGTVYIPYYTSAP